MLLHERRVHLEHQWNLEVPRQLETGRAEQALALVDQIGAELLEHQAALQLEARRIQQIAEVFREPRAFADLFVLQRVVQRQKCGSKRHFLQREPGLGVAADVGGKHDHVVPIGPKRLREPPDVRRCPLGSEDRHTEVGC